MLKNVYVQKMSYTIKFLDIARKYRVSSKLKSKRFTRNSSEPFTWCSKVCSSSLFLKSRIAIIAFFSAIFANNLPLNSPFSHWMHTMRMSKFDDHIYWMSWTYCIMYWQYRRRRRWNGERISCSYRMKGEFTLATKEEFFSYTYQTLRNLNFVSMKCIKNFECPNIYRQYFICEKIAFKNGRNSKHHQIIRSVKFCLKSNDTLVAQLSQLFPIQWSFFLLPSNLYNIYNHVS